MIGDFSFKLPIYRQAEASECGHTCLAMVASYHGYQIDLASLRRRFPNSGTGIRLQTLMDIAGSLKLATRPVKAPLEKLNQLRLPAILHWDLNHFVVLKEIKGSRAVIHDPAKGAVTLPLTEVSDHYTGVAVELAPANGFEKKKEKSELHLSQLWTNMSGLKRSLFIAFSLSVILQLFALASPFYMQLAVDHVILKNDEGLLLALALGFGAFTLINVASDTLRSFVLLQFGSLFSFQVVTNLFTHMMRLPLPFFERRHIGDIVSRFGSSEPIRQLLTEGLIAAIVDGLMAVTTFILMFIYSPTLAMISLAALVLYLAIRLSTYRLFRQRSEEQILAKAEEQSNFMETVRGMMSVKVFGKEQGRIGLWQNKYANAINTSIRTGRLSAWFQGGNGLLFGLENIIIVYVAISMVITADFTVGMIFAFMAYKRHFIDKSAALVERLIEYRMLDLHLDRLSDIALAEPEAHTDLIRSGIELGDLKGDVALQGLGFRYAAELPLVIENASLTINAGETVAFTGQSGCGKTTLVKILLGLFEPTEGQVLIDGHPLSEIGLDTYRAQTAAVMQDDTLFAGSIADNIAFFDGVTEMSRIIDAARQAAIHDEIVKMPMAYETLVGDMGSTLSGGQIQRVLLARALYRKPKILIMDEGTAHLDVALEKRVNAAIKALGMTRIIVAHRPETIKMADRVFNFGWKGIQEMPRSDQANRSVEPSEVQLEDNKQIPSFLVKQEEKPQGTDVAPESKRAAFSGIQAPDF